MYKIIFVDDEAITLRLLTCVLDWQQLGIEIAGTASDGREALELVRRVSPDIIIADIRMPGMTGVMLSEMIRKSNADVKIIFLSAYAEFEYAQSAIANKVSGYLLKPLDEEQLEELIRKILSELDQREKEKKNTKEIRSTVAGARIREQFLRRQPGSMEETDIPGGKVSRVFFVRFYCPEQKDYLLGTEEKCRKAVEDLGEELLTVRINEYEVFFLTAGENISSDRILMALERAGLPGVCGVADGSDDLMEAMTRAQAAAERTFFSRERIGVWKESGPGRESGQQGHADYENAVKMVTEAGDVSLLVTQLSAMIDEYDRRKGPVERMAAEIYDALIWLKTALMRTYPETVLATGSLRHIDIPRLMASGDPERLKRFLRRILEEIEEGVKEQLGESGDSSVIRRARYYAVQHCLESSFSLQEAADHVGLSRNHFSKVFHEGTGVKFWDYVTQMRIQNARSLLAETDLPIAGIAEKVGYETETHFNRKFKQLEGMPPGKYRKKYGK